MCVVNDASARRRHRAVYLAPSRIPFPTTIQDEAAIVDIQQQQQQQQAGDVLEPPPPEESPPFRNKVCKTIYSLIVKIYSTLKDLMLVVVVMIMSIFFYDVHVSIVKADQTSAAVPLGDSLWTGRVVIQSQEGQIRRQLHTSVV
jgi:hypothetical protein